MEEQVALITGASSGIGKATTRALAQRGLRVFAGVRRPEAGEELRGADITPVMLDVSSDKSVAGRMSTPFAGWYSASKHAVEALADALRLEVVPFGIQVTVVQPAAIKTGFDNVALDELDRTTRTESYRPMAAAFRTLVEGSFVRAPGPEVVAEAVARAATARRAPIRMAVPGQARAMLLLKRLLSDRLFDAMIRAQLRPSTEVQGKLGDAPRSTGRRA